MIPVPLIYAVMELFVYLIMIVVTIHVYVQSAGLAHNVLMLWINVHPTPANQGEPASQPQALVRNTPVNVLTAILVIAVKQN